MTETVQNNKKKTLLTVIIFAVILLISVIIIIVSSGKSETKSVHVMQDGNIIYEFDLNKEKDREIKVSCDEGYNIICIKNHEIYIREADCRDQICVSMGNLQYDSLPIVCLPHRLVIEFED